MAAPNEEISVTQGVMNQWWPWALTRALGTRVRDASLVRTCARSCESRTMHLQHSAALTSLPAAEGIVHTSGERKRRQDGDIDVTNGSSCYAEREVREGGAR